MTRLQLLTFIADAIRKKGGVMRASSAWDIQTGNLNAVMSGRVKPGPRLQKRLGISQTIDGDWVVL